MTQANNPNRQTYQEPPPEFHAPRPSLPAAPAKASEPSAAAPGSAPPGDTVAFRPVRRPPIAVLQVFDDGRKSAELVRLRQSNFVIGRNEGDLILGNDPLLSGRHAELVRVSQSGRHSWLLRDLGSTNGSFVRVKGLALKEEMEVLISRNRFRFVVPLQGTAESHAGEEPPAPVDVRRTMNWQTAPTVQPAPARPFLLELLPTGEGRRFPIREESQFIGRDPRQCLIALPEDDTLNPSHAKLFRDAHGKWQLEDNNSLNGVWLRVREITLGPQSSFLLGEQVFAIAIP